MTAAPWARLAFEWREGLEIIPDPDPANRLIDVSLRRGSRDLHICPGAVFNRLVTSQREGLLRIHSFDSMWVVVEMLGGVS